MNYIYPVVQPLISRGRAVRYGLKLILLESHAPIVVFFVRIVGDGSKYSMVLEHFLSRWLRVPLAVLKGLMSAVVLHKCLLIWRPPQNVNNLAQQHVVLISH